MNQVVADLIMNPKPPTLYAIMNSIANYDKEEKTKIRNLAKATHSDIFDFDYPLSDKMNKEDFECQILNHYIMRRINFDTFNAFQIFLENKLNEILPFYNKLFDAMSDYNLFNDGEVVTRETKENGTDNTTNNQNVNNTSHMASKYSQYPLNQLEDINDNSYVSNQTVNDGSDTGTRQETNNKVTLNNTDEIIKRSPIDKMDLYQKYLETSRSIMTMIYKDLDTLFYGIAD